VTVGVSNQASDAPHLEPMLERIVANTGQMPKTLIAVASYCSVDNIETSEQRELDAYISTSCQSHGKRPRPSRGPVSEITIGREADPSQMGCQGENE
jgi:hypothetical protein